MAFTLYDHVNAAGENEFKIWTETLEKIQRAKLNEKLDKLAQHGTELYPQILTDTGVSGIQKLRIHGNVQLRPLLCKGPTNNNDEFTLLMGAKEIGSEWSPVKAPEKAEKIKQEVSKSPNTRRKLHERIR